MIKVQKLNYSFPGKQVLENISLTVAKGQFIGIVGPNGCGKTTLLRLLTGYLKPDSGQISLNGKKMTRLNPRQRAKVLAVVSQIYLTNPHFTVRKILEMGREPHLSLFHRLQSKDRAIIQKYAEELAVVDFMERKVGTLSGGELQRVMIAKALIQETPLIILDEPVNHLDIHHQVHVLALLKKLTKSGRTIITVLHDLSFAAKYSDELIVLNDKNIFAAGKPDKIFTAELLREVFQTDDYAIRNQRLVLK